MVSGFVSNLRPCQETCLRLCIDNASVRSLHIDNASLRSLHIDIASVRSLHIDIA